MKILILTKNIMAEQSLQKQLQYLEHEVFCTEQAVSEFSNPLYAKVFFDIFECVVISETISQRESTETIQFFKERNFSISILREIEQLHDDLEDEGIEWLHTEASIEELREKFQLSFGYRENHLYKESNFSNRFDVEKLNFSRNEEKVIGVLYEASGQCVDRNTICQFLWSEGSTNSNLSQMSVLINRIREKCERADICRNAIETVWGKGYSINQQFSDFLDKKHYFEKRS